MRRNNQCPQRISRPSTAIAFTPPEIAVILIVIIGVCISAFAGMSRADSAAPVRPESTTVIIHPDDTLWSLAVAYPVDNLSTAQTVEVIKRMNGARSPLLNAGESLKVPTPDSLDLLTASR